MAPYAYLFLEKTKCVMTCVFWCVDVCRDMCKAKTWVTQSHLGGSKICPTQGVQPPPRGVPKARNPAPGRQPRKSSIFNRKAIRKQAFQEGCPKQGIQPPNRQDRKSSKFGSILPQSDEGTTQDPRSTAMFCPMATKKGLLQFYRRVTKAPRMITAAHRRFRGAK